MWRILLVVVLISLPSISSAAGLVPCGGVGEEPCQFCHVSQLVNNVTIWLTAALTSILILVIVVMGLHLVTSTGEVDSKTRAKRFISTAIVGYIIFLAAAMIVDFAMKLMVDNATYGFWNKIQCIEQPVAQEARLSASGYNDHIMTSNEIKNIPITGPVASMITQAANNNDLTDPKKLSYFQAIIAQESSNCTNKVGTVAYGCGQVTVDTARQLDPSLRGMSDEQIKNKLINDNAYNLNLSAANFNRLLGLYGGNYDSALAAYNGGYMANQPSRDCPGLNRWECVWDSPGCYGTNNTDCKVNEGYKETRNYVTNINNAVNLK
ncbi:MAG: lytic transglycosylase domain-containing protein [Candidatus Nomurabacteria bacterium]|nr:lytic transglycosylase domain-containing protein [Candidatus Nomurabacteria bacterium]USN87697.1 MAG: lytic transglycosylase domain-containing protein [Candidatus Nomurabacteria bacterium]